MANFRIRPNNIIQYDFFVLGKRFRETSGLKATPANIKTAKAFVKKLNAALALDQFDYRTFFPDSPKIEIYEQHLRAKQSPNALPYFDDYWHQWFERHKHEWSLSYCNDLNRSFKHHLKPRFGNTVISTISYADLLSFRADLCAKDSRRQQGQKLSNKRINSVIHQLARVVKEAAFEYDFAYPFNPLKSLRIERSTPKPLTKEEVERFLNHVDDQWKDYFLIRFFTGLRSCEIHGLEHQDIDFDHNLIHVQKNWVSGSISKPKTPDSQREIQMGKAVREAFQRACDASKGISSFVFISAKGKPLDSREVNRLVWEPTLKKAGLSHRTPHQTRHTAAILHLAAGENPRYISQLLGHSNGQMLFQVYAPYVKNATQYDGKAFEKLME